jgi:hypothetical protein
MPGFTGSSSTKIITFGGMTGDDSLIWYQKTAGPDHSSDYLKSMIHTLPTEPKNIPV